MSDEPIYLSPSDMDQFFNIPEDPPLPRPWTGEAPQLDQMDNYIHTPPHFDSLSFMNAPGHSPPRALTPPEMPNGAPALGNQTTHILPQAVEHTLAQQICQVAPPFTGVRTPPFASTQPQKRRRVNTSQEYSLQSPPLPQLGVETIYQPEMDLQNYNADPGTAYISQDTVSDDVAPDIARDFLGPEGEACAHANSNLTSNDTENLQAPPAAPHQEPQLSYDPGQTNFPMQGNTNFAQPCFGDYQSLHVSNDQNELSNNNYDHAQYEEAQDGTFENVPFPAHSSEQPPLDTTNILNDDHGQQTTNMGDQTPDMPPLEPSKHVPLFGSYPAAESTAPNKTVFNALWNSIEGYNPPHISSAASFELVPHASAQSSQYIQEPRGTGEQNLLGSSLASSSTENAKPESTAQQASVHDLPGFHEDPLQQMVAKYPELAGESSQKHIANFRVSRSGSNEPEDLFGEQEASSGPSASTDLLKPTVNKPKRNDATAKEIRDSQPETTPEPAVLPDSSQPEISPIPVQNNTEAGEEEYKYETITIKDPVQCDQCDSRFPNSETLAKHKETSHIQKVKGKWTCKICSQDLKNASNHNRHLKIIHHREEVKYSCGFCPAKFTAKKACVTHEKNQHGKEPESVHKKKVAMLQGKRRTREKKALLLHRCLTCSYETSVRGNIVRHIKLKHKRERNFICKVCGTACKSKHNLQIHCSRHL